MTTTTAAKLEHEATTAENQNLGQDSGMIMIVVRSGMEQHTRDSLRCRGIGVWWPNYLKEVAAKDRQTGKRYSRLVLTGIMPGIVLSPSRLNSHFWAALDLAPGAINVVRKPSGDAMVINDVDVAMLHSIEAELNRPSSAAVVHKFEVGDDVVVLGDALRHFSGKIVKVDRAGRVHLEVPMFGRAVYLTVLPHQIARA